jgi:AcrR family transcriptional regulator
VRRERLLQAACELLEEQPLKEVSFHAIAERAGIPSGSAYHFFPNVVAVWAALANRFGEELAQLPAVPGFRPDSWRDLLALSIEGAARYYGRNPAARQVLLGGQAPAEIKLVDRRNDRTLGRLFEEGLDRYYELPAFPRRSEVFFLAVEIIDLVFSLSVGEHGAITDEMLEEARRASTAYLRTYLPEVLPRRAVPRSNAGDASLPHASTGDRS